MELTLIYGVVVLLSILTVSIYCLSNLKSYPGPGLPPGKTGLPVIGESIDFISNLRSVNLEKFSFNRMAKYNTHDVFKTSVIGDHVAMLCGAEGSRFVFSNGNKLVKRWIPRPVQRILCSEELEASLDRYLIPSITAFAKLDGLKTFVAVMDEMTQHHLESHWHPLKVMKVYPSVKRYAFALACRLLLSIEDPDVVGLLFDPMETFTSGMRSMPINLPGTQMNRSLKAGKFLRTHIEQIVRNRRSSSLMESDTHKDNLLTYFIQACENDKEVADGVLGTLVAAHDGVASVITIILQIIAPGGRHSDVYRRVYQENKEIGTSGKLLTWEDTREMRYTWNMAREVMRIYPPAPFLTREAMTDFTYAGCNIPKGYKLLTNVSAIHKDPKYFPEPEKFDPSRFERNGPLPYTYMPFGGGSNKCPGMNFAQLVILVFVHNVVKRFKWETVIANEKILGTPVTRPCQGLPIILHPHSNKSE